jgi:hypothetical protein
MKKSIIALIIVAVIVIIGVVYVVFSSPTGTPTPGTTNTGQTGSLPSTGNQNNPVTTTNQGSLASGTNAPLAKNFGVIANDPIIAYFVTPNNTVLAVEPTGKIIQVIGGQVTTLNSLVMNDIIHASFSYDGAKALVTFGNPAKPQTSVFDIATKAWAPMPAGWLTPVWSPSDYRIAYAIQNTNGTELIATVNAALKAPQPIILVTLHAQDLALTWPNKNQLALETKPSAYVAGTDLLLNLSTLALTPILPETAGLDVAWGKTTGLAFTAGTSGVGGNLMLLDTAGNTLQKLSFLTPASKCAFGALTTSLAATTSTKAITTSTQYLFCAVPRDQDKLKTSHLPDDYAQHALYTADDAYRINLTSGAIDTVLADQTQAWDASNIMVVNNTLFFVNRYDEKLYAAQLTAGN